MARSDLSQKLKQSNTSILERSPPSSEGTKHVSPWFKKSKLSNQEVAQILEDFLEGRGKPLAWDGFTQGMSFEDQNQEKIRIRCARLSEEFPPDSSNQYCNEQGVSVIREYIKQLRGSP
jgi:hypothetical protein